MLFLVVFVIGGTIFTTLVVHTLIIITTRGDRKFSLSRTSLNSSFTHRNAILSLFMQVIWRHSLWSVNEIDLVLGSSIYIWTGNLHSRIKLDINWLYICWILERWDSFYSFHIAIRMLHTFCISSPRLNPREITCMFAEREEITN